MITQQNTIRQEKEKENNPNQLGLLRDPYLFVNHFDSVSSLNQTQKRVMNIVIASRHLKCRYYSHDYIAWRIGKSRETVVAVMRKLRELNLVETEYRQSKTCIYHLNQIFYEKTFLEMIRPIFACLQVFMFAMLISKPALARDIPQFPVKGFNLLKRTCTSTECSDNLQRRLLYSSALPPWLYGTETGVPNKKRTFTEFEALFTNQEQNMLAFTEEQLRQVEQYPKASIDYANKMVAKDLLGGKTISNQFAYFMSICKAHATKTPKTGSTTDQQQGPYVRPANGPQSIYKQEERVEESDFEWCRKVDAALHEFHLQKHPGLKYTKPLADVRFNRLPFEEQQVLMQVIHTDCDCRAELTNRNAVKTETTTPQREGIIDFNSLLQATNSVMVERNDDGQYDQSEWEEVF